LRLDLAIADVDHGDLVKVDAALAVFDIDAKHRRAVVAHAEIVVR